MDNNNLNKIGSSSTEGGSVDRVVINVGGMRFETHRATLQNISDTRLAWLTENADPNTKEQDWFFDRHPGAFVYILNFYRTGKLHTPTDMCGPAFEEELTFWGIDEKQMEPCCWETFTRHREAEENLKNFEGPGFDDLRQERRKSIPPTRDNGRLTQYYDVIWKILDDPHSSKGAKLFSLISCFMIILSVSGYCLSTVPSLQDYNTLLENINYICVVFFTIECISRLLTTPRRKEFMFDYNNWIDFISVVPSYLVLILKEKWVKNLVIIRLLRVFKFFKLSYGLQVLLHTLKASSYELTLLLLMLLIPVVIFSSLVFAIESNVQPNGKFTSIPKTFWWCVITMTTVGYGDLTPVTWGGRMIGTACAIFGLLTVALPISVIGGNFSLYYAHVRARLKLPQKNRRHLQVNMHGLLRQTTSLSSRDRDRKLLRRNQIPLSVTAKVEPKRFLDKLFHKPQDTSPRLDVHAEHSPIPPRPRGRDLRRTALINVDSSDNESNDASVTSSLLQKPESTSNLVPNSLSEDTLNDAFPPVNAFPDKRVLAARSRMRRTALINVESSDNESAESTLSNNLRHRADTIGLPITDLPTVRKVSEVSCNSANQVKEENDVYVGSINNLGMPVYGDMSRDEPAALKEDEAEDVKPIFEIDPGGNKEEEEEEEEAEDNGIVFNAHPNIIENEVLFQTDSRGKFNKLLYVNLDKLKTLSKSLDERIFFGETPSNEDTLQSSSRRDSMKLLTDCEQRIVGKVDSEEKSIEDKNHTDMNNVNELVFPKRRSLPVDQKRNSKCKKIIENDEKTNNINTVNENYCNENNRRENYRNENGRNENHDIFTGHRTNNKLKKNVSLPADVYSRINDDFGTNNNYSTSDVKIDFDPKIRKKLTRRTFSKHKMKSEGDNNEDGDLLSPTSFNIIRSRQMRKESIV